MSFENSAQPTIFAPVVDSPAFEPTDPGFSGGSQWYLDDGTVAEASLNITGVWDDYRGGGITIAVIDDGIEYSHPDLVANSDPSLGDNLVGHETTGADDGNVVDSDDKHGTTVAGVIAADDDGQGVVGVAPDATIASMRIGFGSDHSSWQVWEAFLNAKDFDIVNGSWTYSGYFFDNFNDADSFGSQVNPFVFINDELINAVDQGRGGLGTLFFMAAGNDKSVNGLPDQDVNYHGMTSSPHTIAVGEFSKQGSLTSFSTPGAAVLVSGPATSIRTTDRVGSEGFVSGDTVAKSGTSYAAPAVSGVAALMLEANPDLGYRDVQEILTLSSELVASGHSGWAINGSSNWNGGGRHVSHDAGFGSIDAHNAVRLAETWDRQSTYANLAEATVGSGAVGVTLDRNTFTDTITVGDLGIDLDQVVLHLDMDHTRIGELFVTLTSPDGTTSILMNNAGGGRAFASTFIDEYELTSVQFWDEDIVGDWTISITDNDFNANDGHQDTGVLHDWALTFLGDAATDDDVYVYTSEYSVYGGETGRQTLADGAGVDTMNFAAIQEDLTIDLAPGSTMTLAGNPLTIDAGTSIENAVGGDGNDVLIGNGADNYLRGMRGDDIMTGGVGDDLLDGGTGVDLVVYDAAFDTFTLTLSGTTVTVVDNSGLLGTDTLIDMETVVFSDATYTVGDPLDTTSPPPAEDPIPAEDTSDSGGSTGDGSGGDSSGDDSGSGGTSDPTDPDPTGKPAVVVPAVTHSGTGAGFETVTGDNGDNVLWGGGGNWDKLEGGLGNDAYIIDNLKVSIRDGSKEGEDTIYTDLASYSLPVNIERIVLLEAAGDVDGHDGDNYIEANDLANVIDGKNGRDEIHAWGGDDTIIGGGGNDVIDGGSGVDTAVFAGALADYLIKEHSDGTLTVLDMVGGDGMDRLIHVENLQFSDQTVASPNAVADPSSLAEVGWLPHPSGYAPPAPTILGTLDSFENLVGTAGDDVLYGGGGDADTLTGGDGNDVYFVTSNDIYTQEFNGGGTDTAIVSAETYQNHGAVEVVYMMYGAATVYAGDGSNTVYGNELSNFIHGEAGSDTIFAYDGDDQIFGGSGDDNVEGGAGNDVIDGGNGNDTATYTGDFIQYTVTENTDGSVTVIDSTGAEGTDTLLNIERIAFADQLYVVGQTSVAVGDGTAKPAVVLPPITHAGTAAGGETITGDDGDNVLSGEGGQWDKLEGFNGDDTYIVQRNEPVVIK